MPFISASLKVRPMAMTSPTDFICGPEAFVGAGEFFELPLGNFYDDVIERGLEAGGSLAGDVVGNFVERVADGKLGGDFRDRESGGFRGQRRRPRDARVHFDHDHASGGGIHAELNIRSAGFDADFADDGDRRRRAWPGIRGR